MRKYINRIYEIFRLFGIDPLKSFSFLRELPFFFHDLIKIRKQKGKDSSFTFGSILPILNERSTESGTMSGHYFHQDLLVARRIFKENPKKHIDIGSRTDGFVAHVAVFREIEIFDIRHQTCNVQNIAFKQADLMNLPEELINYCDSISSLHAFEHFGLGRYGDPIDYNGHIKAIDNIYKILKSNGKFYFSVPIGPQRIEFNAHRVFSIEYLLTLFSNRFNLNRFSYVDDMGNLHEDIELSSIETKNNFNCNYGCGIFELTKI